ncbi:MAG: dual specificity protein phosphatase family protein [Isosphaeraceae bacterium]
MRPIAGYSLWLGNIGDARERGRLHAAGIVAVVDLALNEPPVVLPRELTYCRFPLLDGPGNPPWLLRAAVETVARLVREDVATLVFCGAGMSRSPCVAGAAIARARRCLPAEGLALVLASGVSDVSPGLWSDIQAVFAQE